MAEKEYIEREAAIDEIESLSVTVTGLRDGKNLLTRYAKHYKDSVVKVLSDAPRRRCRSRGAWGVETT